MNQTNVPEELTAAYRKTHYHVRDDGCGFVLQIGHRSPELAERYTRSGYAGAVFITGYDPFSQIASQAENNAQHLALGAELQALTDCILLGEGRSPDGDWPGEASYLTLGIDRSRACALGEQFQQNAIVWVGPDAIPELVLLR